MALVTHALQGQITTLTLNRPEKRNALNDRLVADLLTSLRAAGDSDQVRTIIVTGAGKSFCAGADLRQLEQMQDQSGMANRRDSRRLAELLETIYFCDKPVVARVNGDAFGGGAGIVAACDWAFMSEEARIGFPEVRLGFVPAVVMPFVLRRIGERAARDLLLRGRRMDASEAVAVGLVNDVLPVDDLRDAVDALAREIVRETSASAVTLTKQLLGTMSGLDLERSVELGAVTNAFVRTTDDFHAGVSAFLSGGTPPWKESFSE